MQTLATLRLFWQTLPQLWKEVNFAYPYRKSMDSAVGIATSYGLDGGGVGDRSSVGQDFSPLPSISYSVGIGGHSPGVKRPGREADHSFPTSVEVKNTWVYTSTTPDVFMA
jgi:hypothetical protein